MRFLVFLALIIGTLWAGDRYFYNGRYVNELWFNVNQQAQDVTYEIRRWARI
jgi:hypothetical protein